MMCDLQCISPPPQYSNLYNTQVKYIKTIEDVSISMDDYLKNDHIEKTPLLVIEQHYLFVFCMC